MLLTFFAETAYLARDLVAALSGLVAGYERRRDQHTVVVRATRDAVWQAIDAETTTVGTIIPTTMIKQRVPGSDDVFRTIIKTGDSEMTMTWRQALRREGEALHCEILSDGTDPALLHGTDDQVGYELSDVPGGTRLTVSREVTPRGLGDAIAAPFGVRSGARSYKRKIEQAAGVPPTMLERLTGLGAVSTVLAFASFWYLMDLRFAVIVATVILLHELGHAIAMRLVGLQVKGIYLIPFFGGIAVPKTPYRTDFQKGFVCLMGPGFSLVTTFLFLLAHLTIGGKVLFQAVLVSTVINLINLLPALPLDGGHVLNTILTAVNRRLAQAAAWIGAPLGLLAAWWIGSYLLAIIVLLAAGGLLFPGKDQDKPEERSIPMSGALAAALFAGLIVTAAGHGYAGYTAYSAFKQEQRQDATRAATVEAPARPGG